MAGHKLLFQRDGWFFDREGNRYNEDGQLLDTEGNIVEEHEDEIARDDEENQAAEEERQRVERRNLHIARQEQLRRVDRREDDIARRDPLAAPLRNLNGEQGRTLTDYNRPEQYYANRSAIRPPPFQRNDFELKPGYYSLVAQDPFCGLPHEHPMDHVERFEDLASSIKANGVSEDYLYCKLFPYSLHGEAKHWLKMLPPGSLTTWVDTKNAFLSNFFDCAKSDELRAKITNFKQGEFEPFKAAWNRFKGYQRDCPHHGFNAVQLLSIFANGISLSYAISLDTASNGNFNTNSPEAALRLIENLANSNSTKNLDYERSQFGPSGSNNQLAQVTKKLDSMHDLLAGKKSVQFAKEIETFEPEGHAEDEEVAYVTGNGFQRYGNQQGNRGYNSNYQKSSFTGAPSSPTYTPKPQYQKSDYQKPSQGNSYTRNYGASTYQSQPPPSTISNLESMMERLLEGQQKMTVDFNGKFDSLYTDLNGKIEALNLHVKKLDTQVAQTAENVRRQEGFLPAKTDTNPRLHVNAITVGGERERCFRDVRRLQRS